MKRPCLTCGTPVGAPSNYCSSCKPARPSSTARGYGSQHRRARREIVAHLPTPCWYGCGTWLTDEREVVAAHVVDGDPTQGWVPSCRRCNENAKTRR